MDFEAFVGELKKAVRAYARDNWDEFRKAATSDGLAFVDAVRADLERWTRLVASGDLTPDEFAFLLEAKKDLAEVTALKQLGLAKARRDRFVNGLAEVVVGAALKGLA